MIPKERLEMKEQKTGKHNSIIISNKLRKLIIEYVNEEFPLQVANREFDYYLFPSRKGANEPLSRQSLWRVLSNAASALDWKISGVTRCGKHSAIFFIRMEHILRSNRSCLIILHNEKHFVILGLLRNTKTQQL